MNKNVHPNEPMEDADAVDYVPLRVVQTISEAEYIKSLLADYDIQAIVDEEFEGTDDMPVDEPGICVLVPEDSFDEAESILAEREQFDEESELDEDEAEDEDEDYDRRGRFGFADVDDDIGEDEY